MATEHTPMHQTERRKEIEKRIKEIKAQMHIRLDSNPATDYFLGLLENDLQALRDELAAIDATIHRSNPMFDPSWNSTMHQVEQEQRRKEIEKRLRSTEKEWYAFPPMAWDDRRELLDERNALQEELAAIDAARGAAQQTGPQGHLLYTPKTCPDRGDPSHEDIRCPICDGGLSVCSLCGMYEAGLDQPCPGKRE